ncbi:MAG: acyl-CoA carboxylase subunit beta [Clostridiales bacterium]|nr:acyl-CoA carboxylase subunit beta [Clostridiales bacterium]
MNKWELFLEKTARAAAGGGEEAIRRQREKGKLTARERLELLFDPGSFRELDALVEHRATDFGMAGRQAPGDGVVVGFGQVEGRRVYAFSQDFTVLGGTLGEMHAKKIQKVQELALKTGSPLVGIQDSGGARIQEGVDALHGFAGIFRLNTLASGVIPQISMILGPCAGGAVYSPALTDFIVMVEGIGHMFITGPDVIRAVTGEETSFEELGGARTHNQKSGVAHFYCADERNAFQLVRKLLGYLPSNNLTSPPRRPWEGTVELEEDLRRLVPEEAHKPYDVREIIRRFLDDGDFLEVQAYYAPNAVVGFGRLLGETVGVVANQPRVLAGTLDIDASDKIARFVRFCDAFSIPLITLVDTPGYLPGRDQETGGIIRHGAKVLYAYAEATVPKISVVLRKAYGGAYIAMCSKGLGADLALAWPTAEIAVMGADGAANIIFRQAIAQAPDPQKERERLIAEYREKLYNPYVAASRGYIDAVIDPAETRRWLAEGLWALREKAEDRPAKKHGNIPL